MATPNIPFILPRPLRADFVAPALIDVGVIVHEPGSTGINTVQPPLLDASPTLHEPSIDRLVQVPSIDASATIHEPEIEKSGFVDVPLLALSPTIWGPAQIYHVLSAPAIAASTQVHEPTAAASYAVTPPHINSTVDVPWPTVAPTYAITPGTIDASPTVHDATVDWYNNIEMPVINLGQTDYSVVFDGSGTDHISGGDVANLDGDLTVEFWIKPRDYANPARQNPIQKLYWGEFAITLEPQAGALTFYQGEGGGTSDWEGHGWAFGITNGDWQHIVFTRSGQEVRGYKNGVEVGSAFTYTKVAANTTTPVHIGDGYTNEFNGEIEDVALYTTALTGTRILAHYDAKYVEDYDTEVLDDSPTAYWKLNETSGTSFADSSTNSNTGTLYSSVGYYGDTHHVNNQTHEPVVDYTWIVLPGHINTAPTVHEPTADATYAIAPDTLDVSPTVYEPTLDVSYTINANHIDAAPSLYGPTLHLNVVVPHIDNTIDVHEPTTVPIFYVGDQFVYSDGTSGNYFTQTQVNLLDADTSHVHQSFGYWHNEDSSVISRETDYPMFGDYSIKVTFNTATAGADSGWGSFSDMTQNTPVFGNTTYTVSLDALDPENYGITAYVSVRWYDDTDTIISSEGGTFTALGTSTATRLSETFTSPSDAAYAKGLVRYAGYADTEYIYIGKAMLVQGTESEFKPSHKVVGVLEMETKAALNDWTNGTYQSLYYEWTSDDGKVFYINSGGNYWVAHGDGSDSHAEQSANTNLVDGDTYVMKATIDPVSGDFEYYRDGTNFDSDTDVSAPWTPSLSPVNARIMGAGSGTTFPAAGNMYWFRVRDGIDGPVVLEFNAEDIPVAHGAVADGLTWIDSLGATWTASVAGTMTVGHSIDRLDASPTFHEPTLATVAYIQPDTLDASATIHEPLYIVGKFYMDVPTITVGTVHEPVQAYHVLYAPAIDETVLHEPTLAASYDVTVPHIDNTIVTYEPVQVHHLIPMPVVSVGTVHEPAQIDHILHVPWIDASPFIGQPSLQKSVTVEMPLLDAAATLHEPTQLYHILYAPTLDASATVHEPATDITVRPPVLDVATTIHEPTQLYHVLSAPSIDNTITVYAPTQQSQIDPPLLDASPTLYAPAKINRTLPIGLLDASPAVHDPVLGAAGEVTVPLLDASPTIHPPAQLWRTVDIPSIAAATTVHEPGQALFQIAVPLLDATVSLHGPEIQRGAVTVDVPLLSAAATVHSPTLNATVAVTVPHLAVGFVHEPDVNSVYTIATPDRIYAAATIHPFTTAIYVHVDHIDASPALYDPTLDTTITAPIDHLDASPALHEPQLDHVLHIPVLDAAASLYGPTIASVVLVPVLDASAALHEPVQLWRTLPVETLDASATIHEPTLASVVFVDHLDASPTFYEPFMVSDQFLAWPHLDASPTIHEPGIETAGTIAVPLVDASPTLHDLQVNQVLHVPSIDASATIHEPIQLYRTVEPGIHVVGWQVYEPTLSTVAYIQPDVLDASPTLHEPFVEFSLSQIPTIDASPTLHAPTQVYHVLHVPLVDAAATVHEFSTAVTVDVPALDVGPTFHDPTIVEFVVVPLLVVNTQVHQPSLGALVIEPATIQVGALHEPTITTGEVYVQVPRLSNPPTLHTPTYQGPIPLPSIDGISTVYGPSVTLEAELEIIRMRLGIRQDVEPLLGVAQSYSDSVLVRNKIRSII